MIDLRPGQLEMLGDRECATLLQSHDLGRIAVVDREVRPMAPGSREYWVGIWADEITGRRFMSEARPPKAKR